MVEGSFWLPMDNHKAFKVQKANRRTNQSCGVWWVGFVKSSRGWIHGAEHLGFAVLRLKFHFCASLHTDTFFFPSMISTFLPFECQ